MDENKTPAAAATATDGKLNVSKYSSFLYNNTESAFCQALLTQIVELADDVVTALEQADSVEAAQHAGMIKGLAVALGKVYK